MHDKPTDENNSAPDRSLQPADGDPDVGARISDVPDLVAELSAADPADAPDIADEIAVVLESSFDAAAGHAASGEGREPRPVTGDR